LYQRISKSFSSNAPSQAKNSQYAPRPFTVQAQQNSHRPPTQEEIENEAFNQNKFEAFGLQRKEKHGTITHIEQERLGVLQAKMADFWAQRLERASRFSYNFANIPLHAPGKEVSAPIQPRLGIQPYRAKSEINPSQPSPQHPSPETQSRTDSDSAKRSAEGNRLIQRKDGLTEANPVKAEAPHPNRTDLPDDLKTGIEKLSGYSLAAVRVNYNSPKPTQLQALAYTQGTEIHIAPGQEEHLPHEAWHVVQQAQGRVKPTMQLKDGVPVNDDEGLEREADVMGQRAGSIRAKQVVAQLREQRKDAFPPVESHYGRWRSPLNTPAISTVQLYTDAGGQKRTENDKYVINYGDEPGDDQSKLSVYPNSPAPHPINLIIATGQTKDIGGVLYTEYYYDPNRNFRNDCLSFAENLIRGVDQDSNRAELRATGDRTNGTDRLFGQSDQQNLSIASGTWATGEGASPNIGEAYGITRTRLPNVGETPYHIAAVVAQDGVDKVTLEADAGNIGQQSPIFDIYDTTPAATRVNPLSLTFEETYSHKLLDKPKQTIFRHSNGITIPFFYSRFI